MEFSLKFLWIFLLFLLLPAGINGILDGESIDWERYGFLVKILARDRPGEAVKSCTGTLISASLVLTSGQCVIERSTKERLREFAIFVPKPNGGLFRSTAKLIERKEDGAWALLRIPPQNITELCPPSPAPRWISRLNFRPTLTDGPRIEMDPVKMADHGYALVGFGTAEKAEMFLTEKRLFRIHIDALERPSAAEGDDDSLGHWTAKITDNYTACYDDVGAPLFSSLPSLQDPPIQIGIFQALTMDNAGEVAKEEAEADSLGKCIQARQMRFSLLNEDIELAEAIQRHALAEFVAIYKECEFLGEEEQ